MEKEHIKGEVCFQSISAEDSGQNNVQSKFPCIVVWNNVYELTACDNCTAHCKSKQFLVDALSMTEKFYLEGEGKSMGLFWFINSLCSVEWESVLLWKSCKNSK